MRYSRSANFSRPVEIPGWNPYISFSKLPEYREHLFIQRHKPHTIGGSPGRSALPGISLPQVFIADVMRWSIYTIIINSEATGTCINT